MRDDIVKNEHLRKRDGQVKEFRNVDALGPLDFDYQSAEPKNQEGKEHAVPDQQQHLGGGFRGDQGADENTADTQSATRHQQQRGDDHGQHGIKLTAARELVSRQAPAQPENRPQLFPIHRSPSSQLNFWLSTCSAPTTCRNRSSSEPSPRKAVIDSWQTSLPRAMMPTCVQSFSTISSTCEVRNTVAPRSTARLSTSRSTREATASTPSNGSSRNSSSGLGSNAA